MDLLIRYEPHAKFTNRYGREEHLDASRIWARDIAPSARRGAFALRILGEALEDDSLPEDFKQKVRTELALERSGDSLVPIDVGKEIASGYVAIMSLANSFDRNSRTISLD